MSSIRIPATGLRSLALAVMTVSLLTTACSQTPTRPEPVAIFYPGPPEVPRIQFLTAISSEEDIGVERNRFREFVTGEKDPTTGVARPWDLDHTPGKLYVSDKTYRRIVVVDLEKKQIGYVNNRISGALANPAGIFVDKAGYKYLADQNRGEILVFDQTDEFVRSYEPEVPFNPTDVVVFGDRVYASDVRDESIWVFDRKSGDVVDSFGQQGEVAGAFRFPTHLTVDDDGNIFVTDFLNFRVQQFDAAGNFVRTIGEPGDFPGAMPRPKGIDVDRDGHLYAVDSAFEIVQIFDIESGAPLMPFGKFGSMSGGTWLPAGVHIDYDNLAYFSRYLDPNFQAEYLIYVTNQAGPFKINVYAFGEYEENGSTMDSSATQ